MLYAIVMALALMASCYLLLRKANAIAPDVTPPVRLRRWTAAFLCALVLSHLWYLPTFYLSAVEDIRMVCFIGALFDFMTVFPLAIAIMLVMLQDRRRPLWPIAAMMTPIVVGMMVCIATRGDSVPPVLYVYYLLLTVGVIIYMVRATLQYGRWLRDNFADLEHKEVWQSLVVLAIILLSFCFYAFELQYPFYKYATQVNEIILTCFLVWRVETLSDLGISQQQDLDRSASSLGFSKNIEPLLTQYCEESHFYLQYDITLSRLAREIGINRFYLSQYFSSLGTNYNAYINDLRINHFIGLYREAVAAHRPVIAQQLALDSGFQSYSTFSRAFKLRMGQTVREWMCNTVPKCSN